MGVMYVAKQQTIHMSLCKFSCRNVGSWHGFTIFLNKAFIISITYYYRSQSARCHHWYPGYREVR